MKMKRILSLIFLSWFLFPHMAWGGGPWLWKQFSGFAQIQTNINVRPYDGLLMSHFRDVSPINRGVFGVDVSVYAEFGILDKLDIMVGLPLKYVATGDITEAGDASKALPQGSLFGVSNPLIGLKYGILDGALKLATSLQFRFNPIRQDLSKGLSTGYDALSTALFVHIGGSVSSKVYMFFEAGYDLRTNGYSHAILVRFEVGYNFWGPLTAMVTLNARKSLENGNFDNGNLSQTGLFVNDKDWVAGDVKLMYQSKSGFGVSLATTLIPLYFRYVGFAGAIALGAHYVW